MLLEATPKFKEYFVYSKSIEIEFSDLSFCLVKIFVFKTRTLCSLNNLEIIVKQNIGCSIVKDIGFETIGRRRPK
jgi:hypothetical protein